jgi:predicted nucleic-acid-binding protein
MHGVDTNVLVRFVTQDDAEQARRVDDLIAASVAESERLFISVIVFCELVWVLRSAYGHSRGEIAPVLRAFLETPEFVVEDADAARQAVADYAEGGADLADYLLGRKNRRLGCDTTFTFDQRPEGDLFSQL